LPIRAILPENGAAMAADDSVDQKLSLDTRLVDVYLTGVQSEIEAKLRRLAKFRAEMRKIDTAGGRTDRASRRRAARALIQQAQTMLETNLIVRGMLEDLLEAAEAVLSDVEEKPARPSRSARRDRQPSKQ
jgi:hypothetical protein